MTSTSPYPHNILPPHVIMMDMFEISFAVANFRVQLGKERIECKRCPILRRLPELEDAKRPRMRELE